MAVGQRPGLVCSALSGPYFGGTRSEVARQKPHNKSINRSLDTARFSPILEHRMDKNYLSIEVESGPVISALFGNFTPHLSIA